MNRFKERRKELNLTVEQAAADIGCTVSTLYSWERGDTLPQSGYLIRMSRVYDISTDWLLGLSD